MLKLLALEEDSGVTEANEDELVEERAVVENELIKRGVRLAVMRGVRAMSESIELGSRSPPPLESELGISTHGSIESGSKVLPRRLIVELAGVDASNSLFCSIIDVCPICDGTSMVTRTSFWTRLHQTEIVPCQVSRNVAAALGATRTCNSVKPSSFSVPFDGSTTRYSGRNLTWYSSCLRRSLLLIVMVLNDELDKRNWDGVSVHDSCALDKAGGSSDDRDERCCWSLGFFDIMLEIANVSLRRLNRFESEVVEVIAGNRVPLELE